jgi:hypothetical protein
MYRERFRNSPGFTGLIFGLLELYEADEIVLKEIDGRRREDVVDVMHGARRLRNAAQQTDIDNNELVVALV